VRYLTLNEILELHRRIIAQSGGALGILNLGALESALANLKCLSIKMIYIRDGH
jgi:prophage maintenance system killer protein